MSPPIFRAAEILDMAIQIERQGISFYNACKEMIDFSELKQIFSYLAEQKHVHLNMFFKLKNDSSGLRRPESFDGQYDRNMAAFVRKRVFSTPASAAEKAQSLPNVKGVVDWAVAFEQKSIAFYQMVKDKVRDSEAAVIERIIREEQHHIERLNQLRQKLEDGLFVTAAH